MMADYGFIRVGAATVPLRVADCAYNAQQIISAVKKAAAAGVKLLCFAELGITGYTCGDLFLQTSLQKSAQQALLMIAEQTRDCDIAFAVGLPFPKEQKLYNCAAVVCHGEILGLVPKQNLPNYGEFYELRQFTPAQPGKDSVLIGGEIVPFGTQLMFCCEQTDVLFGVEICEDLWVPQSPSVSLCTHGAGIILNLSAGDELIGKADYRRLLIKSQSAKLACGYVYANAGKGESTTDMVFSGHSLIAENGALLAQSKLFSEEIICADLDYERLTQERLRQNTFHTKAPEDYFVIPVEISANDENDLRRVFPRQPFVPAADAARTERCAAILEMQAAGLQKRIAHTHAKSIVVGVSGGLDSTLALLVCARAMENLGRSKREIIAVTMPCFGTTKRTRTNAEKLCDALGVTLKTVEITASVRQHFADIGQEETNLDVTFENGQARERTQVLMDIANMTGGMVIGTGDLSELALGWATYNGDHMSMYGVNASIPKTLVRHLVAYVAQNAQDELKATLNDVLATPVSPELLPAQNGEISQKTEDLVGPYELHDFFLYYLLRFGFSPKKIYFLAQRAFEGKYDDKTVLKWLKTFIRRFFAQQFKRSCLPDGPKVGTVTLSPRGDWRMPSDACAEVWIDELNEL